MIDCSLDSSVLIDLIKGRIGAPKAVSQFTSPSISHVVFGELLLGIYKADYPTEIFKVLEALKDITILHADAVTATLYAQIRSELEKQGSSIPQNDIWIAAVTIQMGVPLITRDQHFRRISKLKVIDY